VVRHGENQAILLERAAPGLNPGAQIAWGSAFIAKPYAL
jgi:hypothetical protein